MARHSSHSKLVRRECPGCHRVKEFPARNGTCSPDCARAVKAGAAGSPARTVPDGPSETHDRSGDNWTIELRGTRITTLEQMIEHCRVNLNEWRVERFVVNKWEVGRKDKRVDITWVDGMADGSVHDSGQIFVEPLFQVKAWLVRKVEVVTAREELASLKALAASVRISPPKIERPNRATGGYMLELSLMDIQMGRLSRGDETLWDNYDLDIAARIAEESLGTLIDRTSNFDFEKIVFVVGNDLLNSDNLFGTTTLGTRQDNDARYHKVFQTTRDLLVRNIEAMRAYAPVEVKVVPGNHDTLGAWHMGDSLGAYFHNYKDVVIDNAPSMRKYLQFGHVMLMWTHGDKGKRANYPLLMATENPKMFGDTRFREVHTGHYHHTRVEEFNGVRVRIIPSLAAPDSWTSENGYVGALRVAEGYVWNRDEGLVNVAYYTVPEKYARNGRVNA